MRPTIVSTGVSVHGEFPVEHYRLAGLWCLHLYSYNAELRVEGKAHEVRPGSSSIVPPGVDLEYRFTGRSEHVYAHFRLPGIDSVPATALMRYWEPARFAALDQALREAVGWFAINPRRAEVRLWDVLWQVVDGDGSHTPTGVPQFGLDATRVDPVAHRLQSAIELRLAKRIRVGDLLATLDLGLSHNQMLRRFRQQTGSSILEYIRLRRVQRADYLLRCTSLPVKAVAAQVGVPDLQAFNKLIRRELGVSPRAWRESRRELPLDGA